MKKRDVAVVLILSIFTCGIYSIYWFYVTANDLNREDTDGQPLENYILCILLSIITCGIFGIYWFYKFFKKVDAVTGNDEWVVSFLLSVLLTGLIGCVIAQNSINLYLDKGGNNTINI